MEPCASPLRGRIAAAFLLCTVLAVARSIGAPAAEPYRWRNVAINGGGFVTGMVYHPNEPGLLYARTDVGGAYRWDGANERWLALNDDLGTDQVNWHGVLALGLDSRDASRVYLACGSYTQGWGGMAAFLASGDQGRTWTITPLPFRLGANESGRSTGERLQVDPDNGQHILLGTTRDGLWDSTDRGRTWRRSSGFPGRGVTFILFGPAPAAGRARVIYAGSDALDAAALYRSTDGGATWVAVPGQPRGMLVHHAAFDGAGSLYLALGNGPGPNDVTDGAVWKLDSRSGRWTDITPLKPDARVGDVFGYAGLDLDRGRPGTVVVSTLDRWRLRDELFLTTDGGVSWRPILRASRWDRGAAAYVDSMKPHWIGGLVVDPHDGRHAWFVTGYGVWRTQSLHRAGDGLVAWTFANDGLEETVIDELVSPPVGVPLLSAMPDLGGFRHEDLERSPAAGMFRPFQGTSTSIAIAAAQPATVVRSTSGPTGGAISYDAGATWKDFETAPPEVRKHEPGAVAVSADGKRVLLVPKGSRPYLSTDGGRTWTASRTSFVSTKDFFGDRPVADRVAAAVFYIYDRTAGVIYASTDGGESFEPRAQVPKGIGNLQAQPGAEGRVWLPTEGGVLVSQDGGRTFQPLPGVTDARQLGFGRAAPGQSVPAVFVVGTIGGVAGIHRSDDGGRSWVGIAGPGERFGWIRSITGDPRVFGRAYIGTSGRGILYGDRTE